MEEPGRLQSMGLLRVRCDWVTSLSLFTFTHWRRKWQPTPVFLPGESLRQRSLVGYSPWGHKESDTTEGRTLSFSLWVCFCFFFCKLKWLYRGFVKQVWDAMLLWFAIFFYSELSKSIHLWNNHHYTNKTNLIIPWENPLFQIAWRWIYGQLNEYRHLKYLNSS